MLMKTSTTKVSALGPAFPSVPQMFAVGIPFWIVIVAASVVSHTLRGYEWTLASAPSDLTIILAGAAVGSGIYAFLRSITDWDFSRQILAALAAILLIAIPMDVGIRVMKLIIPVLNQNRVTSELFEYKNILRGGIFWLCIFSLWGAACLALLRDREARHRERRMALLQAEAHGIESRLDPELFIRVHRSAMIRVDRIGLICRPGYGRFAVQMTTGQEVPVGRTYVKKIRNLIASVPAAALATASLGQPLGV